MSHRTLAKNARSAADAAEVLFPRNPEFVCAVFATPYSSTLQLTAEGMDAIWDIGGLASDDPDETLNNLHVVETDSTCNVACTFDGVRIVAVFNERPEWLDRWEHTTERVAA